METEVQEAMSFSYLVITGSHMSEKQEWFNLFKNEERMSKRIKAFNLDYGHSVSMDKLVEFLFKATSEEPYDEVNQSTCKVFRVVNWKELLGDDSSWLYKRMKKMVGEEISCRLKIGDCSLNKLDYDLSYEHSLCDESSEWKNFVDKETRLYVDKVVSTLSDNEDDFPLTFITGLSTASDEEMFLDTFLQNMFEDEIEFFKFTD